MNEKKGRQPPRLYVKKERLKELDAQQLLQVASGRAYADGPGKGKSYA